MNSPATAPDNTAPSASPKRLTFRRYLATSPDAFPTFVRKVHYGLRHFSLPAPRIIARPMLWVFLTLRSIWYFLLRVLITEPLWKASFAEYGKNFTAGTFTPWVLGQGDIRLGDDVLFGGKIDIVFGSRFSDETPTLQVGNNVRLGHEIQIIVGRRITLGDNSVISGQCWVADSNGHSSEFDPVTRRYKPPGPDDIRPVVIGENVWIGRHCLIFPGVKIGTGSVIAGGSVVRGHIPPYCVAAGNPAKVLFKLKRPAPPVTPQALTPAPAGVPAPAVPAASDTPQAT
ncbi:MAG: acyltransferase [Planctomycetes bacterium]|nr:acyltransferase [Planctomycetota bacterium]